MAQRVIELHRILKPTGSFYLHCDPTASHYLKLLLDCIFGKENFRNEIVWVYRKWNVKQKQFPKNHDTLLFYSKGTDRLFCTEFMPKSAKSSGNGYKIQSVVGDDGKRKSIYLDEKSKGTAVPDWWEIPIINPMSKERTGYPTQKPLALLHRIIKASCPEGGVVLDPFCGCATTCVAAQQLGRKWIGIDIEKQAVKLLIKRLSDDAGLFTNFIHLTTLPQRTDVERVDITPQTKNDIKKRLFKEQGCKCNGCNDEFEIRHFEVDHIVPKAKGGGDYYENYQLLCSSCNRIKGDRPMEYLRMKMRKIEEVLLKKLTFGE